MTGEPRLLGAVIAGGASRRFGRDKATATLMDARLVDRSLDTLREVFADVVVVSSRPEHASWEPLPDLRPGEGPLAAIESALTHARALELYGAFALAADLPLVTAGTVRALVLALGDAPAAAPARDGEPNAEPLCAAYGIACLPTIGTLLDAGERSAAAAFARVEGVRVPLPAEEFLNVNREPDLARAEALLGARPRR